MFLITEPLVSLKKKGTATRPRKAMGCAQGKSSVNTSPAPGGLEKLKMESGYKGKGDIAGHRRSTGQRYSGSLYNPEQPTKKYNEGRAGGGEDRKLNEADRDRFVEFGGEEVVDGWPKWLTDNIPREVLAGLAPKSAENYDKLAKVGEGTYSNVYKARDKGTGKIVALKKVRFDSSEPESVKFMAREIMILQKLDHPNVVKLEGLATSRMQYSLYLVFDFMQSDLSKIISRPEGRLTEPQHCHERGILHRDIKGSNLLIDKNGMLKIADFGLSNYYSPKQKQPLTSRVVTLWYRAPELLLGATQYGTGIDLWSAGCLLAEMFAGRPFMPGRTEVEQLHRIFKLCGTPSEDYWKKLRLSTTFRPPPTYKPSLFEAFSAFPESALGLLTTLLALDPASRGCASSALENEFFQRSPLPCGLSGLPVIQKDEDELTQVDALRKRRNAKMKRRSQTYRERKKKDLAADEPKEDPAQPKEELKETAESVIQSQEPAGSSSSSSNSSGTKPTRLVETPPNLLLSPVATFKKKMSPKTQGHPKASKNVNNLPPLPASRTGSTKYNVNNEMYRLNRVHRSTSTREFRKIDQGKQSGGLYAVDT
ncbi:unnamed protein product [Dovyalis caffra]|uniref:Protein kinase domain-containing protein n=1 Tax=Dovyalis caffra TaxID=77055 RepID=A0AAV1S8T9_9ROSI|nr:unnamed protein product [Dovyalis caffra]